MRGRLIPQAPDPISFVDKRPLEEQLKAPKHHYSDPWEVEETNQPLSPWVDGDDEE